VVQLNADGGSAPDEQCISVAAAECTQTSTGCTCGICAAQATLNCIYDPFYGNLKTVECDGP
jgi:hypothetical protein